MVQPVAARNLPDISVWFALAVGTHQHHEAARAWFDTVSAPGTALFCRATQQGLLRLLTTRAAMAGHGAPALTNEQAWHLYDTVMADPRTTFRDIEPQELDQYWRRFCSRPSASPKMWMDAYLAAFAAAGGLQLVTTDTAFRQFEGLDLVVLGEQ